MDIIELSSGKDFLTLRFHGRTKPESQDYWEGNWLHCSAEAAAGNFIGKVEWQLRNEDLARFQHELELLRVRTGEAVLETGDGWLDVRVNRDEQGRVVAQCQLTDNATTCSSLEFRISLDQEALLALISQVDGLLRRFPIVGHAESVR